MKYLKTAFGDERPFEYRRRDDGDVADPDEPLTSSQMPP